MPDPFHVRFSIDVPVEEAQRRFINRIENRVRNLADAIHDAARSNSQWVLDPLMIRIETTLGEPHDDYVSSAGSFIVRWRELVDGDISRCLQCVEGFYKGLDGQPGTR